MFVKRNYITTKLTTLKYVVIITKKICFAKKFIINLKIINMKY